MSPEMRGEVKRLDQYTAEAKLLCQHKLQSLEDVRNHKETKQEKLKNLYNERDRLYYKRKSLENGIEKDVITEEIIKITDKIKNVKIELFCCDDIAERSNKMVEEIRFIEEDKWKRQKERNRRFKVIANNF